MTDLVLNEETGCINGVVCGKESFKADALILGIGISTLQEIVQRRYCSRIIFYYEESKFKKTLLRIFN